MILICGKFRPPTPLPRAKMSFPATSGERNGLRSVPLDCSGAPVNDKVLFSRFHWKWNTSRTFKTFVRCYSPYLCPAGKLTSFSLILAKLTSLQTERGPEHNFWHCDFLKLKTKQNKTSTAFHKCQKGRERYEKNISANGPPMRGIS